MPSIALGGNGFQGPSLITKVEVLENLCGDRCGKGHVESAMYWNRWNNTVGETIFPLTSLGETWMKTYARPMRKVPYTHLCESTLWGKHLSPDIWFYNVNVVWKPKHDLHGKCQINTQPLETRLLGEALFHLNSVSLSLKCLRTHARPMNTVQYTHLCERSL